MGSIKQRMEQIERRLPAPANREPTARIVIYDADADPGGELAIAKAAGTPVVVALPDNGRNDTRR